VSAALPIITGKACVRALERGGFYVERQVGSHARLFHRTRLERRVTVPIHNRDLPLGTLKNILRQADLTNEEFQKLL
jgi:predicted RNA binding protein YcfA (HicA-like mRNA interferase family)